MIEGLVRDRLQTEELADQVAVSSAGVFALEGEPSNPIGVALLPAHGIDISDHIATYIGPQRIETADLILVMEEGHRSAIFPRAPQHLHKVMLFSELINEHDNLADLYHRGQAAYEQALARMDVVLTNGWDTLLGKLGIGGSVRRWQVCPIGAGRYWLV